MGVVLGVDPGLSGALAFLDPATRDLTTFAMPVEHRSNGKSYVDAPALARMIESARIDEAWVEDVYSSPQMGVVSAFSFGEGKGTLIGVLAACGVPVRLVSPSVWKAKLGLSLPKGLPKKEAKRLGKAKAKAMARALFPRAGKNLSNEGKCEAALIAQYGALTHILMNSD